MIAYSSREKLIFRKILIIESMVISQKNQTYTNILEKDELDRLFDIDLRPMRSKNARTIYLLFLENRNLNSLTTLDLQPLLEKKKISLKKKEINAWLKNLHKADLLTREHERGKPTTTDYAGRYTYDLWRLTPKGLEIAYKLDKFMLPKTSLENYKSTCDVNFSNKDLMEPTETAQKIEPIHLSIMTNLAEANGFLTIEKLKANLTSSWKSLEEFIETGVQRGYYRLEEAPHESSVDRFLRLLGIPRKGKNIVEMTDLSRKIMLSQY